MKPTFNIPSDWNYFDDVGGNDEGSIPRNNSDTSFKISWFEEQVDLLVAQRIITNHQTYHFNQGNRKPSPKQTNGNKSENTYGLPEKIFSTYKNENKNEEIPGFLRLFYNFSSGKLGDQQLSKGKTCKNDLCAMPCEVISGTTPSKVVGNDRGSKSYYEASGDTLEGSDNNCPLSELELFIQNTLESSFAKFKDEINKTIDNKFESLKSHCHSEGSSFDLTSKPSASFKKVADETCSSYPKQTISGSCFDQAEFTAQNTDNLDGQKTAEPQSTAENATSFSETKNEKWCTIFNLMQPEIRNMIFRSADCFKHFQSESVNIIKNNVTKKNSGNLIENDNGLDPEHSVKSDKGTRSLDIDKETINPCDAVSSLLLDLIMPTEENKSDESNSPDVIEVNVEDINTLDYGSSENVVADVIKNTTHPQLLSDLTKFMYIIFESFRRLKEEDQLIKPSDELCGGLACTGRATSCLKLQKMENGEGDLVKKCPKTIDKHSSSLPTMSPNGLIKTINSKSTSDVDFSKCSTSSRPIISPVVENVPQENDSDSVQKTEREKLIDEPNDTDATEDLQDSGYTIHRFVKDRVGYRHEASQVLESLKEQYLENPNSIDENILSLEHLSNKYECQIKKKYCPSNELLGNKFDSEFYCNIGRKSKNKCSELKSIKRVSTKSSNIISMRHSLIRTKHKCKRSLTKKIEVSLDSTIISLLDISARNNISWMRKLSSLPASTSDEGIGKETGEKGSLLKRLCFIKFAWSRRGDNLFVIIDRHLTNIYNAICLDYVSDDVYRSVLYVSEHLRNSDQKTKEEIMKRWVKICSRSLAKEKKSFHLDCLHQFWIQFRTKICHLARPPPNVPPGFFPALTYPSKENRLIKEQVIQKYARDILEYISDPKLFKHNNCVS